MIIYRYIDKSDEEIKYVGIVHSHKRNLHQRVREHDKYDKWTQGITWKIEYVEVQDCTRTDIEYLEAHLIALYETDKWYNKAKSGWGVSRYLPNEFEWREYVPPKEKKQKKRTEKTNEIDYIHLSLKMRFYESSKEILSVIHSIKYAILNNQYETSKVQGYIRITMKEKYESVVGFKEIFHPDKGGGKFDNEIPYIIDLTKSRKFDGVNNTYIVIHESILTYLEKDIKFIKNYQKSCMGKAREVLKNEKEYDEFVNKYLQQGSVI